MVKKTMTLRDALIFAHEDNLVKFGFALTYLIENPTDKNNEPAFGFFTGRLSRDKLSFTCNVDGVFTVVNASSVVVVIEVEK